MKIAILVSRTSPESGGAYSYISKYIRALHYSKHFEKHKLFFINAPKDLIFESSERVSFHEFTQTGIGMKQVAKDLKGFLKQYQNGVRANFHFSFEHKFEKFLRNLGIDFVWSLEPLTRSLAIPYANTIWDLNHRTTPWFPEFNRNMQWELREARFEEAIKRASLTFVSCEYTKNEVEYYYRPTTSSVVVIPYPRKSPKSKFVDRKSGVFFYPAQFWEHKNHKVLIEAAYIIKRDNLIPGFKLIFVGSDQGNFHSVRNLRDELKLNDVIEMPGFVSQDNLQTLYQEATALIYPSLLGPDNLPPLEAIEFNCPRLVSDIPGARKIYGKYAAYFDPFDAQSLAKLMVQMNSGNSLHEEPDQDYFEEYCIENSISKIESELSKFEPIFDRWNYKNKTMEVK